MALTRSTLWILLALAGAAGPVLAAPPPAETAEGQQRVVAVLVRLDRQGAISDLHPSHPLPPALLRQLRGDLAPLIAAGHPERGSRARQFVANLALDAVPLGDGRQAARFSVLSTTPVPAGAWYWSVTDNRQLRLVNRDGMPDIRPVPGLRDPLQGPVRPVPPPPPPPGPPPAPPRPTSA